MSQPRFEPQRHDRSREALASRGIHLSRYRVAREAAPHKQVLDIACGAGYGVYTLAPVAARVTGADLDFEAVAAAGAGAGDANAAFVVCEGSRLPFASGRFDLVTSFETLEHLFDRTKFLSEIRRVLVRDGILLLSTPNANHTQPVDGKPRNPYHVHEYEPTELLQELSRSFGRVELSGQVLDESFRIPPFWDEQERLRRAGTGGWRLVAWKIFNKLPYPVGDHLSRRFLSQPLFPDEADYRFDPEAVQTATVLFARCYP